MSSIQQLQLAKILVLCIASPAAVMALALRVLVSTTSIRPATPASAVRAPLLALAVMPRALAAASVVPVDSTSAQISVRPAKATAAHAAMQQSALP